MSDNGEVKRQPKMGGPDDRRGFMIKLAAGAGAVGVASTLGTVKLGEGGTTAKTEPGVRRFLGELQPGRTLEGRWTIEKVEGRRFGAIAILLRAADGSRAQVDVLRRNDAAGDPSPIATTDSLALYLSNRGNGGQPTVEEHGLGVMALSRALARREEAGNRPPSLLSFAERRQRHPLGSYAIV